ncbi:MAG TPA: sigma-54 dependent transcriptional regulator [Myxococcales bacterium]|jgi:two-component system response regulator HydG
MGRKVLVVDDDRSMCDLLEAGLRQRGYEVVCHLSPDSAFDALSAADFDVALTDLSMPGTSGAALCERITENRPDVPVIVVTGHGSLETAVAAIRAGAYDFITKPVVLDTLAIAVERALQHRVLHEEVRRLREVVAGAKGFDEIVGASTAMQKVYALLERVADTDASVLITGESGTGKEIVARALHRRGRRREGPFVAINCAAMPETLLETELFGHVRGAFTDAKNARSGLLVQANGGTLFLDEIGEMPLGLQPKLLRALQERRARPVGGDAEVPFDVRVVASTNRDLDAAIEERLFREDLYFRVNVIPVELPPLRARGADVLLLAQHFAERFAARGEKPVAGIAPQAAEKLLAYHWPGNVRELQNCIERAVALTRYERIAVDDLPEKVRSYRRSHVLVAAEDPSELVTMEEVERRYITRVLETVRGNKTLAARLLGFDRKTLYRKLERYGQQAKAQATG